MPARRLLRGTALTLAGCTTLIFLPGCGAESTQTHSTTSAIHSAPISTSGTFFGPSQGLGNGTVKTYVSLDDAGEPTEVGLRLTPTALDGLPPSGTMLMLDFSDEAATTAFDHVMLNWNPQGHDPIDLFGKPHFDMHFDMVDMATMHAISPDDPAYAAKAENLPEARYMPQDYSVPPGLPPAAQAVPGMGVHWLDFTDTTLVPGTYDFQHILLNGSWNGRHTFYEPMVTTELLMSGPDFEQPLKQPQAYQLTAHYPTTYGIHVDEQTNEYVISLGGMTARSAS